MELIKPKFKKTQVGQIPADWSFEKIEDHIDLLTGFPFPSSKYSSDGIRLLKGANVKRGQTDWGDKITTLWNEDIHKYKQYDLKDGDLVIAMDGSLVGRSYAMLSKSDLPALLLQRVARIRSKKLDINFLKFFVGSDWFIKYCDSVKTVTAIPHISPKDIRHFQIPLPSLTEQKAIATALSDVDELITGLENLITKKKAIKQGAMQQLLTPPHKGGKRLPGFTGEWVEKTLRNVADFYKGKGLPKSQISVDGKYECIHYGELFTKYNELIDRVKSRTNFSDNTFVSRANDVLMPTSDVTPNGLATASAIFEDNVILGGDVLVIRPNKNELFGGFLSYQVKLNKPQIMALVSGSTVYHLYGSDMAKFTFAMPRTAEQKAIVVILSDMDTEIEQLESKKVKYQSIKQGMMQELLTGKTRLI